MKLRFIILILSLLAVISVLVSGGLYYFMLQKAALNVSEQERISRFESIGTNLSCLLAENVKPVKTLAAMPEMRESLSISSAESLAKANVILDVFARTLHADVCYVIDLDGNTVASSNRLFSDSFVGQNFAFRPYFKEALRGASSTYLALGVTSHKRGAYFSHPIYRYEHIDESDKPIGAAVIKTSIERIETDLQLKEDETVLVVDMQGVIFISNRRDWLMHSLKPLDPAAEEQVRESRQFGSGPWPYCGLTITGDKYAYNQSGSRYLVHQRQLEVYPDWQMIYLQDPDAVAVALDTPFIIIVRGLIVILCLLISSAVVLLYKQANAEIHRRKMAEKDLAERKNKYRYIYHHAPAMLHSVDRNGRLIDVSDHWLQAMGYRREEVIGQPLEKFLSPSSAGFIKTQLIPEFFQTGYCQDIPYQFRQKNGQLMDALVSAIGERDKTGKIIRSLTVSIDITERKKAEEALRKAQEELQRYSSDLERQVKIRTEEITGILKYTPDVLYIKDINGRYLLVNPRFEELFGVRSEDIRGKTSHEVLPQELADQFQLSDEQVFAANQPCRVEHRILQGNETRIYLTVKFPIYDEYGKINGLGGISTDITGLKKAEQKLSRLSGSIIEAQERERAAIARELHDELGQMLTVLRMDAVWIEKRIRHLDEQAVERINVMCQMIDRTIEDVRGISMRLRPGVLDTLGLIDALEWYTGDFERRTGITCVFECDCVPVLNSTASTAAYRIVQESLTNAVRHGRATRTDVVVKVTDKTVMITVSDNGCGFDPEIIRESEGLGLTGMRERAALAGGTLEIESLPGEGARVCFIIEGSL